MKRHLILLFMGASLPFLLSAQQKNSVSITKRVLRIPEVTVVGKRPMKDIGVQRTRFDSVAMKENIALSMADVLTFNSSVFVKNYGRATLSTVAFRGTSPSHTQVTWNGMRINNPMLGMTDFSTIPSYFIDDASLLHGTSSVNETGGGLGGLVKDHRALVGVLQIIQAAQQCGFAGAARTDDGDNISLVYVQIDSA